MSFGTAGWPPAISVATALAHALACALAENADFGMPPAIQASPMTWILRTNLDSNVTGSIAHHPLLSAAPAIVAIWPAFCGGITFATCAVYLSKYVISVLVDGSTEVTLTPCESETHSAMS